MVKSSKQTNSHELGAEVHFLRYGTHSVDEGLIPMLPVNFIAKFLN